MMKQIITLKTIPTLKSMSNINHNWINWFNKSHWSESNLSIQLMVHQLKHMSNYSLIWRFSIVISFKIFRLKISKNFYWVFNMILISSKFKLVKHRRSLKYKFRWHSKINKKRRLKLILLYNFQMKLIKELLMQ